ncbi:MAG TPA: trypsin-like peptidase domain-containing protein [Candidatus Limnocylindrales bacterium]|nr:trypsin-like peptidase domain-containing protein [Candidatus Limnocylindrales bacterium]
MKHTWVLCIFLALLFLGGEVSAKNFEQIALEQRPGIVAVISLNQETASLGTGFVVNPRGYVLTNYHVIQQGDLIGVKFYNGEVYDARPVAFDEDKDIAVLKIDGVGFPTVLLGNSSELKKGEAVIAIGNPLGWEGIVTPGRIKRICYVRSSTVLCGRKPKVYDYQLIETSTPLLPGNSGGPLINSRGEIIGINTLRSNYPSVNFAVPINYAKSLLSKLEREIEGLEKPMAKSYRRNDLASTKPKGSAAIQSIWLEPNILLDGEWGLRFHVNFLIRGYVGEECSVKIFFYYTDGRKVLNQTENYTAPDRQAFVQKIFIPESAETSLQSLSLFIPYYALPPDLPLQGEIVILDPMGKKLTSKMSSPFYLSTSYLQGWIPPQ